MIPISQQRLVRLAAIGAVVAALGLSACGRKGPLDPPPTAAVPGQPQYVEPTPGIGQPPPGTPASTYTGLGKDGRPAAPPPGERRPFFLDWLVN